MGPDARDDNDLVLAVKDDPEAFGVLYARHESAILRFFIRRTACAHTSADLTADTFMTALTRLDRFDPTRGTFGAWLNGIAQNQLRRHLRRSAIGFRHRNRLVSDVNLTDTEYERIEQLADFEAVRADLESALADLPAKLAEAVRGRIVEERSYAELASLFGCSQGAVRVRVSRALSRLAENDQLQTWLSACCTQQ